MTLSSKALFDYSATHFVMKQRKMYIRCNISLLNGASSRSKCVCVFLDVYGKTKKINAIIRSNRNYLVDNIQPNDELIASLLSLNCITEEHSHLIRRQRSIGEKNYELLRIMECIDETTF